MSSASQGSACARSTASSRAAAIAGDNRRIHGIAASSLVNASNAAGR
jgi:hypothetical protein